VASGRRRGVESSATRAILIEAAGRLIREEGYAAVTARRVASEAGLKPQLVHYYFSTMDDLFVAVVRRGGELMLEQVATALASGEPLRAVWHLSREAWASSTSMEYLALANRRKAVRNEVRRFSEQVRSVQLAALTRFFEERGIDPSIDPIVTLVLMSSVSQLLMLEEALGMSLGHAETAAFIEGVLQRSERAVAHKKGKTSRPAPRKSKQA
jgi:TetR/AcrR family transcriptional regulator